MAGRQAEVQAPSGLTAAAIERRLPVWCALSDLFLDNELQPFELDWIARQLVESGFSTGELRRILIDEVAPAFAPNLMGVAGEWAGWGPDDVREIVLRSMRCRRDPFRWFAKKTGYRMVASVWSDIERRIEAAAGTPA